MKRKYVKDIQELHDRNYSIYDDVKTETTALKELHNQSYLVLNDEEITSIFIDYYDEEKKRKHIAGDKSNLIVDEDIDNYRSFFVNQNNTYILNKKLPFLYLKQNLSKENDELLVREKDTIIIKQSKKDEEKDKILAILELLSTIQSFKEEQKYKQNATGKIISTILLENEEKITTQPSSQPQNKELPPNVHILKIKEEGVCDAAGYYDPESALFYLLQGSKIALNVAPGFALSTLGKARERLLSCNCIVEDGYYVVQKDSKCRSAATAACYVMGRNVTYMEWISEDGKALKDYYPERFFRKKAEQEKQTTVETPKKPSKPVVIDAIRIFKIRAKSISGRELEASGHYDNVTNKFVLMSKSTWSQEVTKSYQYTASEMLRRNMAKTSCKLMFGTYIQFKDVLCESPDQAASFVLGRNANGLEEWKDEKGKSLKDYLYSSTQE